jgi:catechol 2,3-dioxygenase-like lactoylglutathione lyase family enzyme
MFRSVVLGSNDLEKSKTFYDAAMGAAGFPPAELNFNGALVYRRDGAMLIVTPPLNGEPATAANGGTIAITFGSEDQVRGWHDAGAANGGTSIENPPGKRTYPSGQVYSAYLRDPDGNKLCGIYPIPG